MHTVHIEHSSPILACSLVSTLPPVSPLYPASVTGQPHLDLHVMYSYVIV